MSITVNIHQTHRRYTQGLPTVEVDGKTVGECLDAVAKRFPDMAPILFQSNGKLHTLLEIFLNSESTYPDELAATVADGDELHITVMLAGG